MVRRRKTAEEKMESQREKSEKLKGNKNAQIYEQPGKVVRLSGATVALLTDYFALQGNLDPSSRDFTNALHYAATKVYGHQIEQNEAMIH